MKIYIFLAFCVALLPSVALAKLTFPGTNSSSKTSFYSAIAVKGGMGESGTQDDDLVESRGLYRYGADLSLGIHWKAIVFGLSAEYILWKQKTKPSEVSNTNMSGKQINFAPLIGIGIGQFMLQAKSNIYSKLTLDKKDNSGNEVVYTSPILPAYAIQLNYRLAGSSFIGLEYTSLTYEKKEINGDEVKFTSNQEVTYSGWGVVYGLIF